VIANFEDGLASHTMENLFHGIDESRIPMEYFANLFGGGHEGVVRYAMGKQLAVRWHRRAETVGDVDRATADKFLREADCSLEEAEEIYKLTSLCTFEDRFVIPPMYREEAIEMIKEPGEHKAETGFGFVGGPRRGL